MERSTAGPGCEKTQGSPPLKRLYNSAKTNALRRLLCVALHCSTTQTEYGQEKDKMSRGCFALLCFASVSENQVGIFACINLFIYIYIFLRPISTKSCSGSKVVWTNVLICVRFFCFWCFNICCPQDGRVVHSMVYALMHVSIHRTCGILHRECDSRPTAFGTLHR